MAIVTAGDLGERFGDPGGRDAGEAPSSGACALENCVSEQRRRPAKRRARRSVAWAPKIRRGPLAGTICSLAPGRLAALEHLEHSVGSHETDDAVRPGQD